MSTMSAERLTQSMTLRITPDMDRRIEGEAAARGIPTHQAARLLIDEALRSREFPGIVFRDGPAGRRPSLEGALDVWEVIDTWGAWNGDDAAVCRQLGIRRDQLTIALAYYRRYQKEIDFWIRRNVEEADRLLGEAELSPGA